MRDAHKSNIRGAAERASPALKERKGFRGYDVLGNIVIVKFSREEKLKDKKKWAEKFLKEHKQIRTVLEKTKGFSNRLRTQSTKWVAGEKIKEALYKENGCMFRLNVDTCYFSPRLSTERADIASKVKRGEEVLVMFGGVAPFAVVIAKNSKAKKVTSVELGREPSKYALENVKRNRLHDKVEIVQGDVRRNVSGTYNRVVMARPNLKDSFLDIGFKSVKKGGTIHYYGFYPVEQRQEMIDVIKEEAQCAKRTIRITKIKKAGEIGTKKFRYRVDIKIVT